MSNSQFAVASHALAVLAHDAGSAPLAVLAESVNADPDFLASVMSGLVRAGLVETRGGHGGGYHLLRPASQITLEQVHAAVEPEGESLAVGGRAPLRAALREVLTRASGSGGELGVALARFTVADMAHMAFGNEQMPYIEAKQFDAEVLGSDVPILVDFTATWCSPCQKLAPILEQLAHEAGSRYRIVKVDIDDAPEIAQRFAIRGVPTVVAFHQGKSTGRHVGLTDASTLRRLLGV